jgi:twinkle protein
VLKVKFQNLGENGAEAFFTWEPKSGSFIPEQVVETEVMPWD